MLTVAGATCCPLSPGLALTCMGSVHHTDCSPHQVQAVSHQIMCFCSERLTSDLGWSLKYMQWAQFIDYALDFTLSPQPEWPSLRVLTVRGPVPSCPPASSSRFVLRSPRLHPRPRAGAGHLEA